MDVRTSTRRSASTDEPRPRKCGFRFSAADAAVIVVAAAATVVLWGPIGELALLFPVVVVHFFLFCNVFRIRRSYELVWADVFVANLIAWQAAGAFGWASVLAVQGPVTAAADPRGDEGPAVSRRGLFPDQPEPPEPRRGGACDMSDRHKKTSKFLSLVLRPRAGADRRVARRGGVGGGRRAAGRVPAERARDLARGAEEIVAASDKQRFALSPDGTRIRANQGHSVDVELGLEPAEPPAVLYHGTAAKHVGAIRAQGRNAAAPPRPPLRHARRRGGRRPAARQARDARGARRDAAGRVRVLPQRQRRVAHRPRPAGVPDVHRRGDGEVIRGALIVSSRPDGPFRAPPCRVSHPSLSSRPRGVVVHPFLRCTRGRR